VKQAYHHKDLRNALIDEALAVLSSEGSGALTLRELARRLGVTHTAPYAHFADKAALLEAVADVGFERLATLLANAGGSDDAAAALMAMGVAYLHFARENPNLYRLMFVDPELADDPDCQWSEGGERAFEALTGALARIGIPDGVEPRDLGAAVWSMVHGVAMLDIDRRMDNKTIRDAEEVLRLGSGLVLAGLREGRGKSAN
jgi:AcrR family transcriptional regulator